jgi:hypothetical protein
MIKKAAIVDDEFSGLFNQRVYFENLKTKSFGSLLLYAELVETTMNSIEE